MPAPAAVLWKGTQHPQAWQACRHSTAQQPRQQLQALLSAQLSTTKLGRSQWNATHEHPHTCSKKTATHLQHTRLFVESGPQLFMPIARSQVMAHIGYQAGAQRPHAAATSTNAHAQQHSRPQCNLAAGNLPKHCRIGPAHILLNHAAKSLREPDCMHACAVNPECWALTGEACHDPWPDQQQLASAAPTAPAAPLSGPTAQYLERALDLSLVMRLHRPAIERQTPATGQQ